MLRRCSDRLMKGNYAEDETWPENVVMAPEPFHCACKGCKMARTRWSFSTKSN